MSSTATARRAPAPRRTSAPRQRKPRLKVISGPQRQKGRRHLPEIIAAAIVCLSLLAIVVGHSMLAQGQLRMGKISAAVAQEEAINRVTVLNVAALETPARISQEAGALHLVQPTTILQLPSVSLETPLPPLQITPAGSK